MGRPASTFPSPSVSWNIVCDGEMPVASYSHLPRPVPLDMAGSVLEVFAFIY